MSPFLDGWDHWDTPCTCSQVWQEEAASKRIDALPDLDHDGSGLRRCAIHNVVMDGKDWRQLATFTAR